MLAEDEARRVAEHFFQIFGDREFPFIYRIPDRDRLFLVSALRDHRGEGDFGRRFFLLEEADGSLQRTFRGRGAGDSYSLDPTFYRGDGRVLILAEMGAEYSWGLWAYDLTGSTLRDLGPLDVAFWSGENHVNPLDHARVLFERGGYLVEFRVNLDLGPGGLHPWNLIRTGDAITFEQQEERFVLSGDSIGGQVCFFYLGEAGTQDAAEVLSDIRHFYRQLVPWLERNRLSHSFQENAPLRMEAEPRERPGNDPDDERGTHEDPARSFHRRGSDPRDPTVLRDWRVTSRADPARPGSHVPGEFQGDLRNGCSKLT
jgi:hypothetical protein